jgi:hypothetical protein
MNVEADPVPQQRGGAFGVSIRRRTPFRAEKGVPFPAGACHHRSTGPALRPAVFPKLKGTDDRLPL